MFEHLTSIPYLCGRSNFLTLKNAILHFCIAFFPLSLFGQVSYSKPEIANSIDSAKKYHNISDYENTTRYADKAYSLSLKFNDSKGVRNALFYKAAISFDMQKLNLSDSLYREVERMAKQARDTLLIIKSLNGQGGILSLQANGTGALLKYYEAIKYAERSDPDVYHSILSNMALAYLNNDQFQEALENLLITAEHFRKTGDKRSLAIVNNNIGELYREHLEDFKLAKKHFYIAIELNRETDDIYQLSKNYNNLGLCFKETDERDSALFYMRKALVIKKDIHDVGGVAITHYNLGNFFLETGKYQLAITHMDTTLSLSRENGIELGFFYSYQGMGQAYQKLGDYDKAEDYLLRAYRLGEKLNTLDLKISSYRMLYNFYKEKGDYQKALTWLEKQKEKQDSISTALRDKGFSQLRTVYEKEMSEIENRKLKAQQTENEAILVATQRSRFMFLYLVIGLFIMLGILLVAYRQRQIRLSVQKSNNQQLEGNIRQMKEQQEQLDQMNQMKNKIFSVLGHDLRSPLTSILGFINILETSENNNPELDEVVEHLKSDTEMTLKTLENILAWSRLLMDEKSSHPTLIELYPFLSEQVAIFRSPARLKGIEIELLCAKEALMYADERQLRSIISNLMANALKFSKRGTTIRVIVEQQGEKLDIIVQDEGVGINPQIIENLNEGGLRLTSKGTSGESGTGIGLKLVKEFTEINGGTLTFKARDTGGTQAMISFVDQKQG